MPFDHIAEKVSERLYEDERLRSNFTDAEATTVLNWAAEWIKDRISAAADEPDARSIADLALARMRPILREVNAYAARGGSWDVSQTLIALAPALSSEQPLAQTQVAELLTSVGNAENRV